MLLVPFALGPPGVGNGVEKSQEPIERLHHDNLRVARLSPIDSDLYPFGNPISSYPVHIPLNCCVTDSPERTEQPCLSGTASLDNATINLGTNTQDYSDIGSAIINSGGIV